MKYIADLKGLEMLVLQIFTRNIATDQTPTFKETSGRKHFLTGSAYLWFPL